MHVPVRTGQRRGWAVTACVGLAGRAAPREQQEVTEKPGKPHVCFSFTAWAATGENWEVRELGPHTLPYRRAEAAGRPWQRGTSPSRNLHKGGSIACLPEWPWLPLLHPHPGACSAGSCALAWHGPRVADSSILRSGGRTKPMAGAVDRCVVYALLMGICIFKKLQT